MSTDAFTPLAEIGARLRTQDNRITQDPMFCVQILRADTGYDHGYTEEFCWWNAEECTCLYDTPPDGWDEDGGDRQSGWEKFGYKTRWETVMVAFTEKGCEEYLELDGHNCRSRAHKGQVRIYAESFRRCPEMLAIRAALLNATGKEPQP
jgi:hypothetical protein